MIFYDRKYVMKRILLTWRKANLEVVGTYEFLVKNKAIVKLYKQPTGKCILELMTHDGKYAGMLEVNSNEYKRAKIGATFGNHVLLRHYKNKDYYIIAKSSLPEYAVNEVSRESKIYLFILLAIIFLATSSTLFMIMEILQL